VEFSGLLIGVASDGVVLISMVLGFGDELQSCPFDLLGFCDEV